MVVSMLAAKHSAAFNFLLDFQARKASLSPPLPSRFRSCFPSRRRLSPTLASSSSIYYRPHRLSSRCSIGNADVSHSHAVKDEDIEGDLPASHDDRPLGHLDTDVRVTESLTLLNECTYADTLLTALPVLSEDEQNAIAANPAHPEGLLVFYAGCSVGNLVEQLWNFAWPSAIAMLHPSLLPVAVIGFFTKVVTIIGAPVVGNLMDHSPRVPAYISMNVVQAAAQVLSASMIILAHTARSKSASSLLLQPWFLVLVVAASIERLSGVALGVAMERDWVVLLAGISRPIALAEANAVLNRIDLLSEIGGTSLFGILLCKYDPVTCLKYAVGLMICSLPIMIALVFLTNKLSSGVLERAKCSQSCCGAYGGKLFLDANNLVDVGVEAVKLGWKEYIQQPILPASLACVLLYFNIVLTPGTLMTAFLTQRGVNPSIIGGFSGLCAFMGVAATFLSAKLVKQFGIIKVGAVGLMFQASLLAVAVAVYLSGSLTQQSPLLFFLSMIVFSRLGHMSYDVVGAQILQTGIPTSKANLIGSTEISVASLAESVVLGFAIIANDVSHFGFLVILSLLSVVSATWMFCRLLISPTEEQRSLFPCNPRTNSSEG